MNFDFDMSLSERYKNNSQKIRIMSEQWVENNIYCPNCGNTHIINLENNKPVADYQCDYCGEIYELKSKKGNIGKKIIDGAYATMIDRITGLNNPGLFVMQYSKEMQVVNLAIIPKFFFVPTIIEKRKPLSHTARRAGWIGCNILFSKIPKQGKIFMIENQSFNDIEQVVNTYNDLKTILINNIESRSWFLDTLNCINLIPKEEFSLRDVYMYVEDLQNKHINNHNVEAKIRQQLQILRDRGFIEFIDRGHYKKIK